MLAERGGRLKNADPGRVRSDLRSCCALLLLPSHTRLPLLSLCCGKAEWSEGWSWALLRLLPCCADAAALVLLQLLLSPALRQGPMLRMSLLPDFPLLQRAVLVLLR